MIHLSGVTNTLIGRTPLRAGDGGFDSWKLRLLNGIKQRSHRRRASSTPAWFSAPFSGAEAL
jgi:hypothetical protein